MMEKPSQFGEQLPENTTDLAKEKRRRSFLRSRALSLAMNFTNTYDIGERLSLSPRQLGFFERHFAANQLLKSRYKFDHSLNTPQAYAISKYPIFSKLRRAAMAVSKRTHDAAEELRIEASSLADFNSKGLSQLRPSPAEIETAANRLATVFVDHHRRFSKGLQKSVDQTITQITRQGKNSGV